MTASLEELMAIRAQKKAESSYVPDRDPTGFSNVLRAVAKRSLSKPMERKLGKTDSSIVRSVVDVGSAKLTFLTGTR